MKFAEVLPHLEAGRRVARKDWRECWLSLDVTWGNMPQLIPADITAADWLVLEEPATRPHACSCNEALRQDVARLTRERDEANARRDAIHAENTVLDRRIAGVRMRLRDAIEALP